MARACEKNLGYLRRRGLDTELCGINYEIRLSGRLERRGDAGEFPNQSGTRLFVQSMRIARFAYFERRAQIYAQEIFRSDHALYEFAIRFARSRTDDSARLLLRASLVHLPLVLLAFAWDRA